MSQLNAATPSGADDFPLEPDQDLQFDQAEFTTPVPAGPTCDFCNQPIADLYFETGGKVFCENCRGRIEQSLRGGSRLVRVLKAFTLGTIAALAGGILYYAIIKATDINFGLIAVLVGFMVGKAVRAGSANRGGLFYQILAVFLTYSSIVAMHVPYLVEAIGRNPGEVKQAEAVPAKNDADPAKAGAPAGGIKPKGEPKENLPATVPPTPDPKEKIAAQADKKGGNDDARPQKGPPPNFFVSLALFLAIMIGILYAMPIQVAIHAPISGLIFGFALWESWKITKKAHVTINGPFRVGTTAPEAFDHG